MPQHRMAAWSPFETGLALGLMAGSRMPNTFSLRPAEPVSARSWLHSPSPPTKWRETDRMLAFPG